MINALRVLRALARRGVPPPLALCVSCFTISRSPRDLVEGVGGTTHTQPGNSPTRHAVRAPTPTAAAI